MGGWASARLMSSSALSSGTSSAKPTLIPERSASAASASLIVSKRLRAASTSPRHHAQELVATEAHDQVEGAQVRADRPHHVPQQGVSGGVPACVVDDLQTDDVDVDRHELAALRRSAGTIDLMLELRQAGRTGPRPGEMIGLGDRELVQQCVAIGLRLDAISTGLLTVTGSPLPVRRGRSLLSAAAARSAATLERRPSVARSAASRCRRSSDDSCSPSVPPSVQAASSFASWRSRSAATWSRAAAATSRASASASRAAAARTRSCAVSRVVACCDHEGRGWPRAARGGRPAPGRDRWRLDLGLTQPDRSRPTTDRRRPRCGRRRPVV